MLVLIKLFKIEKTTMSTIIAQNINPLANLTNSSDFCVGRDKELNFLNQFLQKATQGNGSFIVISGEQGLGRTTLVNKFIQQAQQQNVIAIHEKCSQLNFYNPYLLFYKIIERLNSINSNEIPIQLENLEQGDNNTSDTESLYSIQTKFSLVQQRLAGALLEVAYQKLLILCLTDADKLPLTTWQFFHYLSKRIANHKILIITTIATNNQKLDTDNSSTYLDIIQRMNREGLVQKLELTIWDEEKIYQYLKHAFTSSDLTKRFISFLSKSSLGSPATLKKILMILIEKKILYERQGVWFHKINFSEEQLAKYLVGEDDLKAAINQLVELSEQQRIIVYYSAILNGYLNYSLIAEVMGLPRNKILKELHYLKEKRILVETPDGASYQFKNSAIRLTILSQIPDDTLTAMYLKIAQGLEQTENFNENDRVYLLAKFYGRTTHTLAAFQYLVKAVNLAIQNLAFNEAKEYLDKAIIIYQSSPEKIDKKDIGFLALKGSWLCRMLGLYADSIYICDLMSKIEMEKVIYNQIQIQQGLSYFRLNDWTNAKDCFNRCLNSSDETDQFNLAMVNFGLGNIYIELADYNQSQKYFETALNIAQKSNQQSLVATIYNNLGILESIRGQRMRAISYYSRSIPVYQKLNDHSGLARIYHNIGMTYADEKNWVQADEFYKKSFAISDSMGFLPLKSITFLNRALALTNLKQYHEAKELNFKAFCLLERLTDNLGLAEYYKIQGILERELKNYENAKLQFEIALHKYAEMENKLGKAETEFEIAILELNVQHPEESRKWFNQARASFLDLGLKAKVEMVDQELSQIPVECLVC
jgi:tetratricopeptide (TPR) repeat protein